MKTVFIIDIDTTIANTHERAKVLERECLVCLAEIPVTTKGDPCPNCKSTDTKIRQSTWDAFLDPSVMGKDTPWPKAQEAIHRMRELGMEFHFITGRNEKLRTVTEEWLQNHFGWDGARESLCMRPLSDVDIPASVYKLNAFRELVKDRGLLDTAFIFFEDDPHVFRMYQQHGIVIRCPEGWDHWMPETVAHPEPNWSR